jgi:hypothetical protein
MTPGPSVLEAHAATSSCLTVRLVKYSRSYNRSRRRRRVIRGTGAGVAYTMGILYLIRLKAFMALSLVFLTEAVELPDA